MIEKIDIDEFIESEDYGNTLDFIETVIDKYQTKTRAQYPGYDQNHFEYGSNLKSYQQRYSTPFFDKPIDNFLTKGKNTYLVKKTFHTQMNIFFKGMLLRMLWNDYKPSDPFLIYIYNHYKENQPFETFSRMEMNAKVIWNRVDSIEEFTRVFIYNPKHEYYSYEDIDELLTACEGAIYPVSEDTEEGLLLIADDFENLPDYIEENNNELVRESLTNDTLSNTYFYGKIFPMLKEMDTTFNFAPLADPDVKEIFNPVFTCHKIGTSFYFIPQLLLFYAK